MMNGRRSQQGIPGQQVGSIKTATDEAREALLATFDLRDRTHSKNRRQDNINRGQSLPKNLEPKPKLGSQRKGIAREKPKTKAVFCTPPNLESLQGISRIAPPSKFKIGNTPSSEQHVLGGYFHESPATPAPQEKFKTSLISPTKLKSLPFHNEPLRAEYSPPGVMMMAPKTSFRHSDHATISRDNTADECLRKSASFAYLGSKLAICNEKSLKPNLIPTLHHDFRSLSRQDTVLSDPKANATQANKKNAHEDVGMTSDSVIRPNPPGGQPAETVNELLPGWCHTLKCICNPTIDYYRHILNCHLCDTWQHLECYYPYDRVAAAREDFDHSCVDCNPRMLDRQGAHERQILSQNRIAAPNHDTIKR
ncbi:hypothetical protein FHL15_009320 [Xylaria flabelliformis]|uniref:Zinc finger PHD-type domain-containing protein n=1 Tax=Xylaria flabelliformis TaxID=2512241 RepID=A0A553HP73_9PEZI|nr:hypothetical protein FHL15_009320 [Xylaria flabelliformis]